VEHSTYSNTLGFIEIADILPPGTTHQDLNLLNGNTYYYRVRAQDYSGNLGFYSDVRSTCPWVNLFRAVAERGLFENRIHRLN